MLNNISVTLKGVIAFTALAAISIAANALVYFSAADVGNKAQTNTALSGLTRDVTNLELHFLEQVGAIKSFLAHRRPRVRFPVR